jgi:hypothetical protein
MYIKLIHVFVASMLGERFDLEGTNPPEKI